MQNSEETNLMYNTYVIQSNAKFTYFELNCKLNRLKWLSHRRHLCNLPWIFQMLWKSFIYKFRSSGMMLSNIVGCLYREPRSKVYRATHQLPSGWQCWKQDKLMLWDQIFALQVAWHFASKQMYSLPATVFHLNTIH